MQLGGVALAGLFYFCRLVFVLFSAGSLCSAVCSSVVFYTKRLYTNSLVFYSTTMKRHGFTRQQEGIMQSNPVLNTAPQDPHTKAWFCQLEHIWSIWKKNETFYSMVHERFFTKENPFNEALLITKMCCDSKKTLLAFAVMDTFEYWLKDNTYAEKSLTEDDKQEACEILEFANNLDLTRIILRVFQLMEDTERMLSIIQIHLNKKKYKEACQLAHILQFHSKFTVDDFLLPLVLQDRFAIAEHFLAASRSHQEHLVQILDGLLGQQNVADETAALAQRLGVENIKQEKLQIKPLKKLVARIVKKFNLPDELCPNLSKKQKGGALQYMLYKRFVDKTIGEESWREMAHEAVQNNMELQLELIRGVHSFGSAQESLFWARKYQLPLSELPCEIRALLEKESAGGPIYGHQDIDDSPDVDNSDSDKYHSLVLPFSNIVIVDTPQALNEFMHNGLKREKLVGLDAEWKPFFGGNRTELALLQFATFNRIFLIDIISLKAQQVKPRQWHELGSVLFFNDEIIKIGFGLKTDLKAIESALPHIGGNLHADKGSYLDLQLVWQRLSNDFNNFVFPYPGDEHGSGEGLSNLVYLCLGKPLNKDNQFSNWERRPLRERQILYAALDAFCLLELYSVLESECTNQSVPFHEIISHVMHRKSHPKYSHTYSKVRSAPTQSTHSTTSSNVMSVVPLPAKFARVVCDTMVQGLGKRLRQLGIDTYILSSGTDHSQCARIAQHDSRLIVTRGSAYSQLMYEVPQNHIYQVRSDQLEEQVDEVLKFFNIIVNTGDIFSRCQNCNCGDFFELSSDILRSMAYHVDNGGQGMHTRKGVAVQYWCVPPPVFARYKLFYICDGCGKCYWDGSHMQRFLSGKVATKAVSS